jgi:transmembrane sensor
MSDSEPQRERRAWHTREEWSRLSERIAAGAVQPTNSVRRIVTWGRLAAAAIVIVAIGGLLVAKGRSEESLTRIVSTTAGERLVVHLSDSSIVTLGPATTLRFTATAAHRLVQLDGLAEFNVVHDESRPFIVDASGAETRDIGTDFVVRAYRSDSAVRVTVTAGTVSLAPLGQAQRSVVLHAGNVGVVHADGATEMISSANAAADVSWVSGGLTFDDQPLAGVAADLSRWFDIDMRVEGAALARRHISAVYTSPTLAGVLDAMKATMNIEYTRVGRNVTIREADR